MQVAVKRAWNRWVTRSTLIDIYLLVSFVIFYKSKLCPYVNRQYILNALQLNELSALRNTFYPEYKYLQPKTCIVIH